MAIPGTLEHKKELEKSSNIKIVIGIVGMIASRVIPLGADPAGPIAIIAIVIGLLSLIPWFWGLADYARSKGYSAVMAVLGICSIIGLLVLVVLPNKYIINSNQPVDPNSPYPRYPNQ
jgi:hypothetical protein